MSMRLGLGLGIPHIGRAGGAWTPAKLFASSEEGAWYDPSDLSTLWKDTAGTDPVMADGDLVARIDDKSGNGNHATQVTSAARPLYKTDGTFHWLLADGVDDWMPATAANLGEQWWHGGAWRHLNDGRRPFGTSSAFQGAPRRLAGAYQWFNSAGSFVNIATGDLTVNHVFTVEQASTTSLSGRFNGASSSGAITPADDSAALLQGLALFSQQNDIFANGLQCRFYGGAWGTGALTNDERAALEEYMAARAGVTL